MRSIILFTLLGLSACATKGTWVPMGFMESTSMAVGQGPTRVAAMSAAQAAIPEGYEFDRSFMSPVVWCASPEEAAIWNPKTQNGDCLKSGYIYHLTLLPKNPEQRTRILEFHEKKFGKTYIAEGETSEQAAENLAKLVPKDSVVEGYSIGCTIESSHYPENGYTYCDQNIPGNRRKVSMRVLRPNAEEYLSKF